MNANRIEVSVCVARNFFLYLPILYAEHTRCFGLLPQEYDLAVEVPPTVARHTDEGIIETLLSSERGDARFLFAVCDPVYLLHLESEERLRNILILGTIVSSSAFWAVNHGRKTSAIFSDLAKFDKIIAYKPGTTSNLIARHVAKYCSHSARHSIVAVEPGQEFISFSNEGAGTLMITPEVEEIEKLLLTNKSGKIDYEFDIGATAAYSNVLTSALLTRKDVWDNQRSLADALMQGLQIALNAMHKRDSAFMDFARKMFHAHSTVDKAINKALDSRVIPLSAEVTSDAWERAASLYFKTKDEARPNQDDLRRAANVYDQCARPVFAAIRDLTQRADQTAARRELDLLKKRQKLRSGAHFILGLLAGVGITVCILKDMFLAASSGAVILLLGVLIQKLRSIKWLSELSLIHWCCVSFIAVAVVMFELDRIHMFEFIGALFAAVAGYCYVLDKTQRGAKAR